MKYFIISQPKAGTYLAANLFIELGISPSWMHISEKKFEQYDPNNLSLGRSKPFLYYQNIQIEESVKLIKDNHFAVGHLPYQEYIISLLKNFKCIFLTRNLTEIIESFDRWAIYSKRPHKKIKKIKDTFYMLENWKKKIYLY